MSTRDETFATDMAATVSELGFELGRQVTITAPVDSDFVPADGSMTEDNSPDTDTVYGFDTRYNEYDLKDTTILRTDVQLIMEIPTIVPTKDCLITMGDLTYSIESVQPMNVQGVTIAYRLQLRI